MGGIFSAIWDDESLVNTGSGKFKVCEGCSGEGISSVSKTTRKCGLKPGL